jgi:UDP-N-acetyl-D-galactosamine dehydrogenase
VDIYDPWANSQEVMHEYGIDVVNELPTDNYSAIVLAVAHEAFRSVDVRTIAGDGVVYDIKGTLPISESDARL